MVEDKEKILRKRQKIFDKLSRNSKNISFRFICNAAETFGFRFRNCKGSHRIYVKSGILEMLNFQDVKGKVKPYQVKQFLKLIKKYNLLEEL